MTHYEKGRATEYWARDKLRQSGYLVVRSAGSKTPIDLVAIGALEVRLIQVKRVQGEKCPSFAAELAELSALEVPPNCVKELWVFVEGKRAWVTLPA